VAGDNLYTAVTAEQVQANISTPTSLTATSIEERQPMAPPREKKKKSATMPRSSSTSSASTAKPSTKEKSVSQPKRPPLPSFSTPSHQRFQSFRTPPRKSKSVPQEEAVYETPITKSGHVSVSQVDEPEECYIEPYIPGGPESDAKEKPVTDCPAANNTEKDKSIGDQKSNIDSAATNNNGATTEKSNASMEKPITDNTSTSIICLTNEKTSEEKPVTKNVAENDSTHENRNTPVETNPNESKTKSVIPAHVSSPVDVAPPSNDTGVKSVDKSSQQLITNGEANSSTRSVSAAKKFFEAKSPPPGNKPATPIKPILHKKVATTSAANAPGATASLQPVNSNTGCPDGTNKSQSTTNKEKTPEGKE